VSAPPCRGFARRSAVGASAEYEQAAGQKTRASAQHVTGTLDLAISLTTSGIGIHAIGDNLQVNNAVLDVDADAVHA